MSTLSSRPQENASSQQRPRYYCYACSIEVPIYLAPDPTCQHCNDQFVQEIDEDNDPSSFLENATEEGPRDAQETDEDDVFDFFNPGFDGRGAGEQSPVQALLQRMTASMLMPSANPEENDSQRRRQQPFDPHVHNQALMFYRGMVDGNLQFRRLNSDDASGIDGERRGDEYAPSEAEEDSDAAGGGDVRLGSFSNLFQILHSLAMPGDGFIGNLNDYVFTQDALDNIITQLMDQGSGSGPSPASESVIDALPKRALTNQEFAQQLDCAVCKDEFALNELEVELPCAHLFHQDCIKPWLKMNGTCPVCRHAVTEADKSDGSCPANNSPPDNQWNNSTFTRFMGNTRRVSEPRRSDRMPGAFRTEAEGRPSSSRISSQRPNDMYNSSHSSPDDPMDID